MRDVLNASAADLVAFCKDIPRDKLTIFRVDVAAALAVKRNGMKEASPSNASKLSSWQRDVCAGKHDAALSVMLAMGVPADFFNRTVRGGGESFNIYAIPKTFLAARMLLSNAPLWDGSSDGATTRGTVLGLLDNAHAKDKGLSNYLNDYMSALGRGGGNYASGGTQSSSSAHALAALGLLSVPAQGSYVITSDMSLDCLERLAGVQADKEGGVDAAPVAKARAPRKARVTNK